ncbi:MAG: transcriptional regulator [Verrucomicrobiales bacterium]|nr:transcriptional regulator [Verrucomicrobiales bacterium]
MASNILHDEITAEVTRLLQQHRLELKMSKSVLAERSGLSRRMIGFVEKQERNPTLDTLLRITGALNIPLEDILSEARKAAIRRTR